MAVYRTKKGLDLPIEGPLTSQAIADAPAPTRVALLAADFVEIRARMLVAEGDDVLRGQPLCGERKIDGVVHTSPAAGRVVAINRGAKRALQSIVIELSEGEQSGAPGPDELARFASFTGKPPAELDADQVRALLVESGMWTALRVRPFGRSPAIVSNCSAVFVTAMDTHPLALSPEAVIAPRAEDWVRGLAVLRRLTSGDTYVCKAAGAPSASITAGDSGARVEEFSGPHPCGTVGHHIHTLLPVHRTRCVWHIGYQDVLAVGRLFATGRLDVERVVSLAGPGVTSPGALRTRMGASLDQLVAGRLADGEQRVISGSVLGGRTAQGEVHGFLGHFHNQVSVIREGREREFIGWLTPGAGRFSVTRAFASALSRGKRFAFSTTTNGEPRAMVPLGLYERVSSMDLMPTFLLRALAVDDVERAEALGALELDEEDMALFTFVCPGKTDWAHELRRNLQQLEKEGVCSFPP